MAADVQVLPVWVTRPAREAAQWVAELQEHGISAQALPLIEIRPALPSRALDHARQRLGQFDVVMFVSANAVRGFFQYLRFEDGQAAFADALCTTVAWAVGLGTLHALKDAGWPASHIVSPSADSAQFDSEALWVQARKSVRSGTQALIVRGGDARGQPSGRYWLSEQLRAAGADLHEVVAYRRCVPQWSASALAQIRRAATDESLWLFNSSEAIANLCNTGESLDWSSARALCTHPRITQAAYAAGFGDIRESKPVLSDVVASIKSAA